MRILVVHNAYQERGGEDVVAADEVELLRRFGHEVRVYSRQNDEIANIGRVALVRQTFWSSRAYNDIGALILDFRPDVMHVHNTFPLISPAVYWRANESNVPVIQTLHNFRLICPQAMLLRNGRICEECTGKLPWRGAVRGCYRASYVQSAVLASMLVAHRAIGTWTEKVTRYIALTEFCREKFISAGFSAERIAVKPNFVDLVPACDIDRTCDLLFVGRLSPEKGIAVLVEALRKCPDVRLRAAGTGSESDLLAELQQVTMLGLQQRENIYSEMHSASALVVPSLSYETFGLVAIEAFACGLPVIASRLGGLAEIVENGVTGLLFEPGNADDLVVKIQWARSHPGEMRAMGRAARLRYEERFSSESNHRQLMAIYTDAIEAKRNEPLKVE